jgi:hypothetical protein
MSAYGDEWRELFTFIGTNSAQEAQRAFQARAQYYTASTTTDPRISGGDLGSLPPRTIVLRAVEARILPGGYVGLTVADGLGDTTEVPIPPSLARDIADLVLHNSLVELAGTDD